MADQRVGVTLDASINIDKVLSGIQGMQNGFKNLRIPTKIADDLTKEFEKVNKLVDKYQSQLSKGVSTKTDAKNLAKTGAEIQDSLNNIVKGIQEVNDTPMVLKVEDATKLKTLEDNLKNIKKQIQDTFNQNIEANGLSAALEKFAAGTGRAKTVQGLVNKAEVALERQELDKFNNTLDEIKGKLNSYKGTTLVSIGKALGLDGLSSSDIDGSIAKINARIDELKEKAGAAGEAVKGLKDKEEAAARAIDNFKPQAIERAKDATKDLSNKAEQVPQAFNQIKHAADDAANGILSAKNQVEQLKQSTQYFFSLRNMINLLKRGIREAVDVVKELDAAMTKTAVVTDYSVGDMWAKLPEYTANANALGATVKDMYEATTLYYQQGLKTEAAMSIANETMKMARIGGLDAADATDKMTAALRGFNMEINEASAQRINDVYSNLAAKTASNTKELGTAMQRTASIAASAGMSFEGTAAFLAQAIETTREPAENLGTAMKTIVARFTELKKNPLEITEVDGEEVDYNKVDTALKSIGVSLKDANGQFRDLDKVFLDISKRWDSLSQTQQRYVATTAAGSRQQSRFIAMMSNYERTMQLMDYANNSAGASSEQFGKTMESLEAKLNKLKNAWNEFLMGIMNDSWTKTIVDASTKILDVFNKVVDVLSFGGKAKGIKSFLSLFTAFKGLSLAGKLINRGIGGIAGMFDPTSSFKTGFKGGAINNNPKAISDPIVKAIHQLQAAITKQPVNGQQQNGPANFNAFKGSYQRLQSLIQETGEGQVLSLAKAYGKITPLDDRQQRSALQQTPAISMALKNGISFKAKDISSSAEDLTSTFTKEINKQLSNKTIDTQQALKIFGTPENFKRAMSSMGDDYAKAAEEILYSGYDEAGVAAKLKQQYLESGNDYTNAEAEQMAAKAAATTEKQAYATKKLEEVFGATIPQGALLAQKFATIGSKAMMAGQAVAQLGTQLSSAGFDIIGGMVTDLGYKISSLGMIITGLGPAFAEIQALVAGKGLLGGAKAVFLAHPYIAAATAIIAAFAVVKGIINGVEKRAQEAGEKVRESFEENFTKAGETINSLNSYKDRFNELAKGVDEFGHNISLSTEEYDEYLSISRELKDLSPSLIAGYNAEGEAIIRKGAAIDEVINKLEKERQAELELYTSSASVNKLIKEYKTSDAYKDNKSKTLGKSREESGEVSSAFRNEKQNIGKLKDKNLLAAVNQLTNWNLSSLETVSTDQMQWLSKHYNDVIGLIEEENGKLDDKVKQGYIDAFTSAGVAIDEVMTEGQPIIDAMQMWMGTQGIDAVGIGLGEEFGSNFNEGFNSIMLQGLSEGWDASKFQSALKDYSTEWKKLAGETSEYNKIMTEAQGIQKTYLDNIGRTNAIENYQTQIENSAVALEKLAEAQDTSTIAGQAFAEQCIVQANALRNYATEGALSLGEALNVLSGKFAEARSAKERFDKAIEGGDYYTAAEGYRSIAETVLDDKNNAGGGSIAAWAGAEELLGQKFIDNAKDWDTVANQVKKVNKLFDDGIEGVYNFNDMLVQAWNNGKIQEMGQVVDGAFEFDFENVENIKAWADELGIAEGVLSAMIDKSRQFAAFNVGNNKEIRRSLEQSNQAMIGQSRKNGKTALYTSESAFRAEARQQGIHGDDYKKTKKDLTKEQNVQFLTVDNLTSKDKNGIFKLDKVLEDVGLTGRNKTLDGAVAALTQMGFSLEEQQRILTADGIKLADGAISDKDIEQAYQEHAYAAENPTVAGIAGDTGVIASAATAMLAQMGIMTDQMKQDIRDATSNPTIESYLSSLNPEGGFKNNTERDTARAGVESQLRDYEATMDILREGGLQDTAEYQALERASQSLKDALDDESKSWEEANKQIIDSLPVLEKITDKNDQQYLKDHAKETQEVLNTEGVEAGIVALQQLKEEGNLSTETMQQLTNEFIALHATDLSLMDDAAFTRAMTQLGVYGSEIGAIRQLLQQPFVITTQLTGADLIEYVNNIEVLTGENGKKIRSIILKSYVNNADKITDLIDTINNEFGDGTEETKSIIVQATAKMAGGDAQGAHDLIQAQFGENAETVEATVGIICDGSIANPNDVKESLEGEIEGLSPEAQIDVKTNVQNIGTNTITVDDSAIETARANAEGGAVMPITAEASAFETKVATLEKPGKKEIKISPTYVGNWTHTLTINKEEKKRGQNYSIPAHHTLSFGAAARGYNLSNHKKSSGQSMTALVGEEGFEVGYIPSEQRSVIFGANGPEITSFPKDTIIYPHRQSQEIVRRGKEKHKTAGSFVNGVLPTRTGSGSSSSGTSKTVQKAAKKVTKSAKEAADAVKKVSVWWENIARKTEASQRIQDKNQKAFENYLKEMRATLQSTGESLESGGGGGDDYIKSIGETLGYYEAQLEKATKELSELDLGTEAQQKAQEAVANATTKKAKKAVNKQLTKANKEAYENNAGSAVKVSYKKGKKTKEEIVDLSAYIKEENGTFVIDQEAIDKVDNREKAKAIADAANKEIDDRLSKKYKAEDEIQKAQEALEKMGEELYETFFAWENELTKIWNITQQIEQVENKISRAKSYQELLQSQLSNGTVQSSDITTDLLKTFTTEITQTREDVKSQVDLLNANKEQLQNLLNIENERKTLDEVQNKLVENVYNPGSLNDTQVKGYEQYAEELEKLIDAQATAWQFMKVFQYSDGTVDIDFDTKKFEDARTAGIIGDEKAKAIQDYVKSIVDINKELNNQYETVINKITELNNSLETLQDQWVGYAEELWQISDEQQKKEVDNLKKLSDSLSNTLKNLLDDVKRKLDQRRKQEDNSKTERDISQKQQRLAALRADTAGGHQVEIAQLEKEIADAQQTYQRSLEDQLLDNLQQQADLAAQQREQQIALQEATISAVNNAAEVNKWMNDPEKYRQEIFEAYKTANEFDKKPEILQQDLIKKFEVMFAGLTTNQQEQGVVRKALNDLATEESQIVSALDIVKESVDNVEVPTTIQLELTGESDGVIGSTNAKVAEAEELKAAKDAEEAKANQPEIEEPISNPELDAYQAAIDAAHQKQTVNKDIFIDAVNKGEAAGYDVAQVARDLAEGDGKGGVTWEETVKAAKKAGYSKKEVAKWSTDSYLAKAIKKWSKFAKGGLADFTGPAWLDGTPSKPELVLNSTDTKNFMALRDVLSKAVASTNSVDNSYGGDATYEININVDHLSNDYDVDKVAEKVKKIIVKDSGYRNVTQVRNFR